MSARRAIGSVQDFESYLLPLLREQKGLESFRITDSAKTVISRIISDWIASFAQGVHTMIDSENASHANKRSTVLAKDIKFYPSIIDPEQFNHKFMTALTAKSIDNSKPHISRSRVERHFRANYDIRVAYEATVHLAQFIQHLTVELLSHVGKFMKAGGAAKLLDGTDSSMTDRVTISRSILGTAIATSPFWARVCGAAMSSYADSGARKLVNKALKPKAAASAEVAAPKKRAHSKTASSSKKSSHKKAKKERKHSSKKGSKKHSSKKHSSKKSSSKKSSRKASSKKASAK